MPVNGTLEQVIAEIEAAFSIVVTAHERPDGDALGASIGLCRILRDLGKDCTVKGLRPYAARYSFLEEDGGAVTDAGGWEGVACDLLIVLDCGAFDRIAVSDSIPSALRKLNIDHHDSNTAFGQVNWVDSQASSVGEMIYRLAKRAGWAISKPAAMALWTAVVTDTGRFSYGNTSAEVLEIGADLVRLGADPDTVERAVYQSMELKELRLTERALASLEVVENGRLACVGLSREDFAALDCTPAHAQEVVNIPRSLRGADAAMFFYELPATDAVKVSVRSNAPLDASALCATFGGGGHQRAAGCQIPGRLVEAKALMLETAHAMWFAHNGKE